MHDTYHPSCAQSFERSKKFKWNAVIGSEKEDLEESSDNQTNSKEVENTQANNRVPITNESSKVDLLIDIIISSEETNKLLFENKELLKDKIAKLENDTSIKDIEIDELKKEIAYTNIVKKDLLDDKNGSQASSKIKKHTGTDNEEMDAIKNDHENRYSKTVTKDLYKNMQNT
ncbi:hypothetical protein WA026_022131 [Henosepilachna vigintioctopunctata]|uniref:Uncharacterized protein n=1 Tax=Henosepilachna vigintioctopunctata TaxID=420089 RepID=A0AAW1TSK6_9CUCU